MGLPVRFFVAAVALAGLLSTPATALAADPPAEPPAAVVSSLAKSLGVSEDVAKSRLDVQNRGHDLTSSLQGKLGDRFASLSFDAATGKYHVYVVSDADRATVDALLSARDLSADSDVTEVKYSWKELEGARDQAVIDLDSQIKASQAQVGIDPAANAVVVKIPNDLDKAGVDKIRTLTSGLAARVEVRASAPGEFQAQTTSCTYPDCSQPMRGGVMLDDGYYYICTTGFYAWAGSGRYMLTAGHCLYHFPSASWGAWDPTVSTLYSFGSYRNYYYGSPGDVGLIQVTGTHWDPSGWTPRIAAWGTNNDLPVNWRDASVVGWYVCRYGVAGGAGPSSSCGYVQYKGLSVYYSADNVTAGNLTQASACASLGDSGGPVMAGGYGAVGIQSGVGNVFCGGGGSPIILYSEAADAEVGLGVTVAHN